MLSDFLKGNAQCERFCLLALPVATDGVTSFLGLPDVSKANEVYVDAVAKAMQGVGSFDQLQEYAKQLAPMGQIGLKFFEQIMQGGAAMAAARPTRKGSD